MRTRLSTTLLSILILAGCSEGPQLSNVAEVTTTDKIVGGEEVPTEDLTAKTVVMIYGERDTGEAYLCTGSIIAENVVLTAAHCILGVAENITLTFGNKPFTESPYTRAAKSTKKHQNYTPGSSSENRNDIALIYFEGGLPPTFTSAPLIESLELREPQLLISYGYGRTDGILESAEASEQLGILRKVKLNISSFSNHTKGLLLLDQSLGYGVCFGDSGGPLFSSDGRIVGIASGVVGDESANDDCNSKSFFTNVALYRDWIIANLKNP